MRSPFLMARVACTGCIGVLVLITSPSQADDRMLDAGLTPLAPLAGWCWQGKIDATTTQVRCFEVFWNGEHVRERVLEVSDPGTSVGEALKSWNAKTLPADTGRFERIYTGPDAEDGSIRYVGWGAAGRQQTGTLISRGNSLKLHDPAISDSSTNRPSLSVVWRDIDETSFNEVSTMFHDGKKSERLIHFFRRPLVDFGL